MITWAYVAGLFDGEGTLQYNHLAIYQKDPEPLRKVQTWMAEQGVPIYLSTRKTPRKTNFLVINQESSLQISSARGIKAVLEKIFPYLIIKKTKAQDWLRFRILYPPMTPGQAGCLGGQRRAYKAKEKKQAELASTSLAQPVMCCQEEFVSQFK